VQHPPNPVTWASTNQPDARAELGPDGLPLPLVNTLSHDEWLEQVHDFSLLHDFSPVIHHDSAYDISECMRARYSLRDVSHVHHDSKCDVAECMRACGAPAWGVGLRAERVPAGAQVERW
jgi:hypothetical protein